MSNRITKKITYAQEPIKAIIIHILHLVVWNEGDFDSIEFDETQNWEFFKKLFELNPKLLFFFVDNSKKR